MGPDPVCWGVGGGPGRSPGHLQLPSANLADALDKIAGILAGQFTISKTAFFCNHVELFST